MKWFGPSWGAPVNRYDTHVSTPVGTHCGFCNTPIRARDQGFILPLVGGEFPEIHYHKACFLGTILGTDLHEFHNVLGGEG